MQQFIDRHSNCIHGVLHGFDRLLFRGTLRAVSYAEGLLKYLNMKHIRLTHFDEFAQGCTRRLNGHIEELARKLGRPCVYLASAKTSKEETAMRLALRDGITDGLVCVISCVEPCRSASLYRNAETKKLEVVFRIRKCKFYYIYRIDPVFGWMHIRIQSWLPFDCQVYVNGRSYLQKQLDPKGIGYEKQDNCFTFLEDIPAAQKRMDRLEKLHWPRVLKALLRPWLPASLASELPTGMGHYYWTIRQSEYATDVMFKDPKSLELIYPRLCRHAIESLGGEDVLRFMGKSPSRCRGQIVSCYQKLASGVRVKHRLKDNSIKMYDKQGSVLRIETTINDPAAFRVYRGPLRDPSSNPTWRSMAKSTADIARRAEVCQAANARYLAALGSVPDHRPSSDVLDPVSQRMRMARPFCRGLRPVCPDDAELFAAVLRGEHLIDGLTNACVQERLFGPPPPDRPTRLRRSASVSRKLRLLRRHGLIHKIGSRRLYRITAKGHQVMSLALAIRESNAELLNAA